jgi:hypothetical protein
MLYFSVVLVGFLVALYSYCIVFLPCNSLEKSDARIDEELWEEMSFRWSISKFCSVFSLPFLASFF